MKETFVFRRIYDYEQQVGSGATIRALVGGVGSLPQGGEGTRMTVSALLLHPRPRGGEGRGEGELSTGDARVICM